MKFRAARHANGDHCPPRSVHLLPAHLDRRPARLLRRQQALLCILRVYTANEALSFHTYEDGPPITVGESYQRLSYLLYIRTDHILHQLAWTSLEQSWQHAFLTSHRSMSRPQ